MTLALIFVDEHGVATGGAAGSTPASATVSAVHKRVGVTQPDVYGKSGAGLSMRGWLKGGAWWRTIPSSALR